MPISLFTVFIIDVYSSSLYISSSTVLMTHTVRVITYESYSLYNLQPRHIFFTILHMVCLVRRLASMKPMSQMILIDPH